MGEVTLVMGMLDRIRHLWHSLKTNFFHHLNFTHKNSLCWPHKYASSWWRGSGKVHFTAALSKLFAFESIAQPFIHTLWITFHRSGANPVKRMWTNTILFRFTTICHKVMPLLAQWPELSKSQLLAIVFSGADGKGSNFYRQPVISEASTVFYSIQSPTCRMINQSYSFTHSIHSRQPLLVPDMKLTLSLFPYRQPIVTGTSVIALKYKDGIMMASDNLGM